MEDRLYHVIEIAGQLLGFGYFIFKVGGWKAEASEMFKTLFNQQKDFKESLAAHQREDDERHHVVRDQITEVKLKVAALAAVASRRP